jgi:stage II sporulation protein GA (sporulation sigma-E factor processing peptidase)
MGLTALESYLDVYLDIILMENLVMNYIILWMTGRFARMGTTSLRLFFGALAGAAYVILLIVFPQIGFYYSIPAKFLLSLLMVSIGFSPVNLRTFIKTLVIFYIVTFVFAGASFAALYLNSAGGFLRHGIIYVFWSSKWATIALAILTTVIVLRVFWDIIQYKLARDRLLRTVGIAFDDRRADFPALVDTGNTLHDPVTNLPVVVVEFDAIKKILPEEICMIFSQGKEDDLSMVASLVTNSGWCSRFRLIPFTSLGKENGMLIGFKPDYIEIDGEDEKKKGIKDVIVGIYSKALSRNRSYQALLSPDLL